MQPGIQTQIRLSEGTCIINSLEEKFAIKN